MHTPLRVVTLGDSLAFGAGDETGKGIAGRLAEDLHTRVVATNLGVNGAQTTDVLARLRQPRVGNAIAEADAVVLSVGANDLFRSPQSRQEILRSPFAIAQRILDRIEEIVRVLHELNPRACIMLLGGYNPVPAHEWASLIDNYLGMWDRALAERFAGDDRVTVVKMADVVTPQRLSRHDDFHPGSEAYAEAAKRIAEMLRRTDAVKTSA